jgi:hypothetical protein
MLQGRQSIIASLAPSIRESERRRPIIDETEGLSATIVICIAALHASEQEMRGRRRTEDSERRTFAEQTIFSSGSALHQN